MATAEEPSPFRCSVCFNSKEARQAQVLSCQHSFCNKCLLEWHEKRHREGHCAQTQVECPTCRTKSALPSGDVSRLPMDINIQQFSDYFIKEAKRISCNLCKFNKGKVACLMCSVLLCEDCSNEHKKSRLFASHVLTKSICELHGAALQCICTTCLCGVCLHCVKDDFHKGHLLEETSAGIKTIKRKVRKCTGQLEELLRKGHQNVTENRTYFEKLRDIEEIKGTLYMIQREIERLQMEIADHERLCKAKIHTLFKEYEAHSKRPSEAILNGIKLLDEEDNYRVLDLLMTAELPNEQMCSQLRGALFTVLKFDSRSIPSSKCQRQKLEDALVALVNCKLVCGAPDKSAPPVTPAPPVQAMKIEFGEGFDIKNPWRLYGTSEGDVMVCDYHGGPVYKVNKDGTKTRLLDDGIAACENCGDVYVISKNGSTVTLIKQDGSTVNHNIKPPISDPRGLAVSAHNVFILNSKTITKQSLRGSDYRETFTIEGCKVLNDLVKKSDRGLSTLVVTTWDTHELIICDKAGSVLTRFGGYGSEDGLLKCPGGISRMSNGHLLVADRNNHRIVEYEMDGTFARNLLTRADGLNHPRDVVYKHPYLWIGDNKGLKLFRFSD